MPFLRVELLSQLPSGGNMGAALAVQAAMTEHYRCMAYKQQKLISHISRDWKPKVKTPADLVS